MTKTYTKLPADHPDAKLVSAIEIYRAGLNAMDALHSVPGADPHWTLFDDIAAAHVRHQRRIMRTRAKTMEGVVAKARLARWTENHYLMLAVCRDVAALAG